MISTRREPFLAWPGWAHLRIAWLQTALVAAWFAFVFLGTNWLTAQRASQVRVHFDAELQILFLPAFTLLYMSIYPLFLAAPFVLRTRHEITALAKAQTVTILVAGISFVLIPARLAFPPATESELGVWSMLFHFADRLNLDYNLVPSLHVALSIVCVELFAAHATTFGRISLRTWSLIGAATLFTHQHHLVDVLTGYALAFAMVKWFRPAH